MVTNPTIGYDCKRRLWKARRSVTIGVPVDCGLVGGSWAAAEGLGAVQSGCGAARGFESQRLLTVLVFSCFVFFVLRTAAIDCNTAVYSTPSSLLTEEGEAVLRSNLDILDECADRHRY